MPDWGTKVNVDRIVRDTLDLVNIKSETGDTRALAERYEEMLLEVGCKVTKYEWITNNPTIVAVFDPENEPGDSHQGKTILFNGHMDVITLPHDPPRVENGRLYGRGACDMKGSLASIIEVMRVLREIGSRLPFRLVVVANSLHEGPGGRGEDLIALLEQVEIRADAAMVMEGATFDCTVSQLGAATFEIGISRDGNPSHQLYTPEETPHPITVAAEIVRTLEEMNEGLKQRYIEDIGHASYFIGSLHSGQFYNQFPARAELAGIRRYANDDSYADVEAELRDMLERMADRHRVRIDANIKKVRDGYRIDKHDLAVAALTKAVRIVRNHDLPLVGKKVVTDAGIIANKLGIPALCHGPNQQSAHADVEYVEIGELELTVKVYLQFIKEYVGDVLV